MNLIRILVVAQALCPSESGRLDARTVSEAMTLEEADALSNTSAGVKLPWQSGPLWGAEGGDLGVQVEVTLAKGTWNDWSMMKILESNVGTISSEVSGQLNATGIAADVILNDCKCFITNEDGHTLPFLIKVKGVGDYEAFGKSQLAAVTTGLYEQLTSGVAIPEGATFETPTDGEGNPIKTLKQELEENPALKGAVSRVSMDRIEDGVFNGMTYSPQQFMLEVEVDKYNAIKNKVGSSSVAWIAGSAGAGKSQDIVNAMYGLLAGQLVEKVAQNGINILISGPTFASKYFSRIGPLSEGNAAALHAGVQSVRSVIPIDDPEDPNDFVNLDKKYKDGLPGGKIPSDVRMWKRKSEDGRKLTGFRLVMTVTSVNENFQKSKLPVLRDGVANTLKEALATSLSEQKLFGNSLFDVTVNVEGCGWKPRLESQPPYPHDKGGCAEPPNKEKKD